MSKALQRELARWYPLREHPVQRALVEAVDNGIRFPVVPSGRRSGKTERAKRFLSQQGMYREGERYFAAAPTYNQAKRIWWRDLKLLTLSSTHARKPSESELIIWLPNGSEIHVVGLDVPARFEGVEWTGGVIDEIANLKGDSLNENIMPALNTVNPLRLDYRAWCWFIGVPEGLNHYYEMAEYARTSNDPDWGYFHWTSEEILPPDVIDAAKRTMSDRQYRQEYRALFETASGRIYDDYGDANLTGETIHPHEALHWSHDQNYTPLSSCIAVIRDGIPYLLDEIVLTSATSRQSAQEFVERYRDHTNKQVYIYGDPHGRAGEKHGHKSDYSEIEQVLRDNGWRYENRVSRAAPAIKDRQNAVRALIRSAAGDIRMLVNKDKAPWCHRGLGTVQVKQGSAFLEDARNQYQHITTAIGYFAYRLWPTIREAKEIKMGMAQ